MIMKDEDCETPLTFQLRTRAALLPFSGAVLHREEMKEKNKRVLLSINPGRSIDQLEGSQPGC